VGRVPCLLGNQTSSFIVSGKALGHR
jgi:hypothetical protein